MAGRWEPSAERPLLGVFRDGRLLDPFESGRFRSSFVSGGGEPLRWDEPVAPPVRARLLPREREVRGCVLRVREHVPVRVRGVRARGAYKIYDGSGEAIWCVAVPRAGGSGR